MRNAIIFTHYALRTTHYESRYYVYKNRARYQVYRAISNARLKSLRILHLRPIKLLVSECPVLARGLMGFLILGRASRLDAFSAYL